MILKCHFIMEGLEEKDGSEIEGLGLRDDGGIREGFFLVALLCGFYLRVVWFGMREIFYKIFLPWKRI